MTPRRFGMRRASMDSRVPGSPLRAVGPPYDRTLLIVPGYFGVDMLGHLQRDGTGTESLLQLATRLAPLADAVLFPAREEQP